MQVLGIDAGTSSCKIGAFSDQGLVAAVSCDYDVLSTKPGYAELDARAIWQKIKDALKRLLTADGVRPDAIKAVGFSSMGEAVVPVRLDRTIVGPSVLSYDSRGAKNVERLTADFDAKELFAINPNIPGQQFTFSKLMWLREHDALLYGRTEKFLFWADFLAFMFGADPFASNSLANRSMLMDVGANDWSDRLLAWSGIDRNLFGRVVHAGEEVGTVLPELADEFGLGRDVRIVSGGHDQIINSLGSGCVKSGDTVVGMGTFECYSPVFPWPDNLDQFRRECMNVEHHALKGLFSTFMYNHSGLLVQWFRKTFAPNENGNSIERLNAELPDAPTDILFLPHNESPQWPEFIADSGGVFAGMKAHTSRGEMFKALLEGITYYFVDAVEKMRRTGICPDAFLASGGTSRSDAWMQIRADIIGIPFTRLRVSEGSLTGAAVLAAVRAGMFPGYPEAVAAYVSHGRTFTPDAKRHEQYKERAALYDQLYPTMRPILKGLSGLK